MIEGMDEATFSYGTLPFCIIVTLMFVLDAWKKM